MNIKGEMIDKILDKCSGFLFNLVIFILTIGFLFIIHESVSIEIVCSGDGCKISRDHREDCRFDNSLRNYCDDTKIKGVQNE